MSNQANQCPGLKLGHNKTRTTTVPASQRDASNISTSGQKRITISNYTAKAIHSNTTMPGYFRLPEYEPTRLERLPAAPQTMFQKEQLLGMLDDFSKHMHDAILQNGIHVPPSIELGLNAMGDISVLGNHPDQLKIGNLFNNNSPLEFKFQQIAFTSRVQQLANLQPGFRGDFFNYPSHSIEQITFVHMRAVELKPFQMTIGQAENLTIPTLDKQIPRGEVQPIHLVISRPTAIPATPSARDNKNHSIPDEHRLTIDDSAPHTSVKSEPDKEEKRHHVHKGKLRCIINS